jgi:hypothetical protein
MPSILSAVVATFVAYHIYNVVLYVRFWRAVSRRRELAGPLLESYVISWILPPFLFGRTLFVPPEMYEEIMNRPGRPPIYRLWLDGGHLPGRRALVTQEDSEQTTATREHLKQQLARWFAADASSRFEPHLPLLAGEDGVSARELNRFLYLSSPNVYTKGETARPFDDEALDALLAYQDTFVKAELLIRAVKDRDVARIVRMIRGVTLLSPVLYPFDIWHRRTWRRLKRHLFQPLFSERPDAGETTIQRIAAEFIPTTITSANVLFVMLHQLAEPALAERVRAALAGGDRKLLVAFTMECVRLGNRTLTPARPLHGFTAICFADDLPGDEGFDCDRYLRDPGLAGRARFWGAGPRECPGKAHSLQLYLRFLTEVATRFRVERLDAREHAPRDWAFFTQMARPPRLRLVPLAARREAA